MSPVAEAQFLKNYFKSREKALVHAKWAYYHVEKPATVEFWKQVIKELENSIKEFL